MSRIIKFRAFQKNHKRMSRVTSVKFDRETGEIVSACFDNTRNGKDDVIPTFNWYHKDAEDWNLNCLEIMQFTGLHDNNGKEIYEGYIKLWSFNHHRYVSVCYWSDIDCGFRWKMVSHNNKQPEDTELDIPFDTEEDYYNYVLNCNQRQNGFDSFSEIIGNIHENPELLKQ